MLYLAPGEIFENMLQLKHFGLYFERILNSKWLLFYIEIMISTTEMIGGSETCSQRKFCSDWCNLVGFDVLFLIRFSLKEVPLFILKNNDYSYTLYMPTLLL